MFVAHFKRYPCCTQKMNRFQNKAKFIAYMYTREKASTMMFSFFWFSLTSRISPNIKTQLHWNHGKHFLCMYVNMVNMQYTIHITAFPWAFPAGSEIFFSELWRKGPRRCDCNTQWGLFYYNSNKNHFVITPELNFHFHVN